MVRAWWFSAVAMLLIGTVGLLPLLASPLPVGSLAGSTNATLDGQPPLPNTTVLSGDQMQVGDGLALVTLDHGSRVVLGGKTEASFSREAEGVTVSLTQGNLSVYHPESSAALQVKAGEVTVAPAQGYKTLGEIAMLDGLVVVTAKDGALQVEKAGTTKEVSAGKTITVATTAAGAPAPVPSGNQHIKQILGVNELVVVGLAAAAAVGATALIVGSHTPQQASTSTPGP